MEYLNCGVVTYVYTCAKTAQTHTHTHIPTNACTTSELRIGSVDCIKVMFLVLILY